MFSLILQCGKASESVKLRRFVYSLKDLDHESGVECRVNLRVNLLKPGISCFLKIPGSF